MPRGSPQKVLMSPRLPPGAQSLISLRVAGMNLRGTGEYDGFLWNKKEIFTTDFIISLTLCKYNWTVNKDFDSCKEFLLQVFPSKRPTYEETFPVIHDVNDDVFVLVNRKESMEKFLQEVVNTMNFLIYRPLRNFLCPGSELKPLEDRIIRVQSFLRGCLAQMSLEERLVTFFREELAEIVTRLKGGIQVALFPQCLNNEPPGPLLKKVLFLIENIQEFGLSRLCLVNCEDFFHIQESIKGNIDVNAQCDPNFVSSFEGIYLSDIAEIRRGMSSYNFNRFIDRVEKLNLMVEKDSETKNESLASYSLNIIPLQDVNPDNCFCVVGYERTLDLQMLGLRDERSLDWFMDMLSLLSINSLNSTEIPDRGYTGREAVLRMRRWRRVNTNSSYAMKSSRHTSRSNSFSSVNELEMTLSPNNKYSHPKLSQDNVSNANLSVTRLNEAQMFHNILCASIEIEEERFQSPLDHRDSRIEANTLWLDPQLMRIYVTPTHDEASNSGQQRVNRGINVDDISEVRPGKISFACDGTPYRTSLCLIGSEGTICLPVDSVDIRNALLRQFQSFVLAYRNPSGCVNLENVFTCSYKKSDVTLTPTRAKRFGTNARSSQRRSSFKSVYPESRPPAHGSGYTRRRSTPGALDSAGRSLSLSGLSDPLGDVASLWVRKTEASATSETPFSTALSKSLPEDSYVPEYMNDTPASNNLFKKLFTEVTHSSDGENHVGGVANEKRSSSVESYVSDEDEEGFDNSDSKIKDGDSSDGGIFEMENENEANVDGPKESPIRRASAALLNVVRRNSLRRDSTISDNNSTAQNQTSEEKQDKCEANSTFLICDHIIKDDAEDGSHSDSPTHSVESYESDDNNIDKSDANIINDSDEANETEEVTTKEKSAIRRASAKMFNLVRRMSGSNIEDDMNNVDLKMEDEKQ